MKIYNAKDWEEMLTTIGNIFLSEFGFQQAASNWINSTNTIDCKETKKNKEILKQILEEWMK